MQNQAPTIQKSKLAKVIVTQDKLNRSLQHLEVQTFVQQTKENKAFREQQSLENAQQIAQQNIELNNSIRQQRTHNLMLMKQQAEDMHRSRINARLSVEQDKMNKAASTADLHANIEEWRRMGYSQKSDLVYSKKLQSSQMKNTISERKAEIERWRKDRVQQIHAREQEFQRHHNGIVDKQNEVIDRMRQYEANLSGSLSVRRSSSTFL